MKNQKLYIFVENIPIFEKSENITKKRQKKVF